MGEPPVDAYEFCLPAWIGDFCVGWEIDWEAYHKACDDRDARMRRRSMRVIHGGRDEEDDMGLDFGEAVASLKAGEKVCRAGWNGKGMWLELQRPDDNSKMTLPYIYMSTVDGNLVPWLASQTDILSEDWELAVGAT